jgi:hypothetical protein
MQSVCPRLTRQCYLIRSGSALFACSSGDIFKVLKLTALSESVAFARSLTLGRSKCAQR